MDKKFYQSNRKISRDVQGDELYDKSFLVDPFYDHKVIGNSEERPNNERIEGQLERVV